WEMQNVRSSLWHLDLHLHPDEGIAIRHSDEAEGRLTGSTINARCRDVSPLHAGCVANCAGQRGIYVRVRMEVTGDLSRGASQLSNRHTMDCFDNEPQLFVPRLFLCTREVTGQPVTQSVGNVCAVLLAVADPGGCVEGERVAALSQAFSILLQLAVDSSAQCRPWPNRRREGELELARPSPSPRLALSTPPHVFQTALPREQ
ncbi:hypothetical protein KUCAC02_023606, partial [Chaenocephalus aceratus]